MADKDEKQTVDEQAATSAEDEVQSNTPESEAEPELEAPTELEQLQDQLDATSDQLLRAQAEMQNMNNRFKKEQAQLLKYDGQALAKSILPVIDNLKRALDIEVTDENGEQLKKGIQMVHDHLVEALTSNSVTEIEALNQPFDPTFHQAVQSVPVEGDQKPNTVVQVLQAGYQLKDRVLRPAMVVVAQ